MLLDFIWNTSGIWFPLVVILWCWFFGGKMWMHYVNQAYLNNLKWVLLEIKIPNEVHKTPEAMEIILGNIFYQQGGVSTWNDRVWNGKLLAYGTLEIVSIEGNIYFFIRVEAKYKNLVETQIYSQFPQTEIREVEDYTKLVPMYEAKNKDGWECRATEFKLGQDDAIPIKTYVDWGLDKDSLSLEEEQRLDPLTPLLENLASLKQGEQMWIQIFVRASSKKLKIDEQGFFEKFISVFWAREDEKFLHLEKDGKKMNWQEQGKAKMNEIIEKYSNAEVVIEKAKDETSKDKMLKVGGYKNLPLDQKHLVDIIQRSIMKFGFDIGMRAVYYAEKDKFNGMRLPSELTSAMRQFAVPEYNTLAIADFTRGWDYEKFQDPTGMRSRKAEEKMFKAFTKRAYFYYKPEGVFKDPKKPFTLNTEELATLFHFPGRTITTPSFTRITSQKSGPPTNLPI